MNDRAPERMEEGREPPPPGTRIMAALRWALVAVMAGVAGATTMDHLARREVGTPRARPMAAGEGAAPAAKERVIYQCPMHPKVMQEEPGECPICGMDLVARTPAPKEAPRAGEVPGLVPIVLSEERIQLAGVKTAPVARAPLSRELRAAGWVSADEERITAVHARAAGWIEALPVSRTGDEVERGQLLATLYSPEILNVQNELLSASRLAGSGGLAAQLVEDARRRLELYGVEPAEIAEIERTGKAKRAIGLRSPARGFVIEKAAVVGLYVQPGTQLFQLADLDVLWVLAEVFEHEAAHVRVGMRARFFPSASGGAGLEGKVAHLYPALDSRSRTVRVRIVLTRPSKGLRPGIYGTVVITPVAEPTLVIPREALVETGELEWVFVAKEGGRFEPRKVEAGLRAQDLVEIRAGLAEGEVVVTSAGFLLDSESRLQGALGGFGATAEEGAR